jgi:two-component system OmpR family sensor kinase
MFRSLATRLTATYVFAAIVLVVIVIAAVTAFALSMFGLSARETTDEVAAQVPEDVRLEVGKSRTLAAAASNIALHLTRPGIRVAVFAIEDGHRRFLAATFSDGPDGRPGIVAAPKDDPGLLSGPPPRTIAFFGHQDAPGGGRPPSLTLGGPPGGFELGPAPPLHRYERMAAFPFSLNFFLRLEPKSVDFAGGRITIFPDPGPLERAINDFWLAMLPIGLFVVVAAWLLGRYITGQALRPLVETTASLNRFGAGDFNPRPVLTVDRSEIGELARAYNAAVAQVSEAFDERRAAELEMRQFIADAGHELRTPLTVIMGFIDVLRRRTQSEPAISAKIYDTMLAESRRMKELIDKLIVLARLENPDVRELETVDLTQIAGRVVSALQALESKPRIGLQVETDALVRGYENELHDALCNLVENALKYAPDSPVEVRVGSEGNTIVVDVVDRGPGIPLAEQTRVFARFYRGRDRVDAEGFGLGLAIAKRAVERAGGEILLASVPGQGCRFTIRIPRAARGESAALAV